MSDNLLRYLPSNLQVLARRQHEELESLRARVPALEAQITTLEAEIVLLERLREQQAAGIHKLERMALDLIGQRDRACQAVARLVAAGTPPFMLAGLAAGMLAVFALRLWGW